MKMPKDPVCGMDIEEASSAGTSEYNGAVFHFCSNRCKAEFDKSPARYARSGKKSSSCCRKR